MNKYKYCMRIIRMNRCHYLRSNFTIDKMERACSSLQSIQVHWMSSSNRPWYYLFIFMVIVFIWCSMILYLTKLMIHQKKNKCECKDWIIRIYISKYQVIYRFDIFTSASVIYYIVIGIIWCCCWYCKYKYYHHKNK